MSRKKTEMEAVTPSEILDAENAAKRDEALEREKALRPYCGDSLPVEYNRDVVLNHINMHCRNMAMNMFEVGRGLILLRENESAKDFEYLVQKEIGMSVRWAYRSMEYARRFANAPKLREGIKSVKKLLAINISDKEIEEAERTGTVLGKPVDEIDRMTEREIRALVKKQEKRLDDAKKQVAELRKKTVDLEAMVDELQEGDHDDRKINDLINRWERELRRIMDGIEVENAVNVSKCNLYTRKRFVGMVLTFRDAACELADEVYSQQGIHAGALRAEGVYTPPEPTDG